MAPVCGVSRRHGSTWRLSARRWLSATSCSVTSRCTGRHGGGCSSWLWCWPSRLPWRRRPDGRGRPVDGAAASPLVVWSTGSGCPARHRRLDGRAAGPLPTTWCVPRNSAICFGPFVRRSASERDRSGCRDARAAGAGRDSRVSRPDLPPGGALLRTAFSEVCGTDVHLWHGRLAGVPYPIIPGHVSAGMLDAIRGPLDRRRRLGAREKATASCSSTCIGRAAGAARAPCTARRRAARRGASTASPIRRPRGCSAAGRRRSTSSPASASRGCRTP